MNRPPRNPNTAVLPRATALWAAMQGATALAIVALALVTGSRLGMPESDLRAFVFTVLVITNVALIFVNRSFSSSLSEAALRPNPTLWVLVVSVLVVLTAALYWQPAQVLFHFAPLHLADISICLAAGIALLGVLELGKRFPLAGRV